MPDDFTVRLERLRQAQGDPSEMALIALDFLLDVQPQPDILRDAINAAAVPHWFDDVVLAYLLVLPDKAEAVAILNSLQQLPVIEPFIRTDIEAYNVHETTRLALRRRMFQTHRGRLRDLSFNAVTALGKSTMCKLWRNDLSPFFGGP